MFLIIYLYVSSKNKIKNLYVHFCAFMLFRVLVAAPTKKKKQTNKQTNKTKQNILIADYLK